MIPQHISTVAPNPWDAPDVDEKDEDYCPDCENPIEFCECNDDWDPFDPTFPEEEVAV